MKILIATDWYVPVVNGVVVSVTNLRDELKRQGHDVRILTLAFSRENYVDGDTYYIGSINAERVYHNARLKTASARRFVQDMLDWSPDIIHTQCEFSTFWVSRKIAKRLNIPIVHTYHTVYEDYTHYFMPNKQLGKAVVSMFSRDISKRVGHIIVPTEKVRDILLNYSIMTPISTVPSGLDLEKFNIIATKEMLDAKKKEYGIPLDNRVILYLGRIAKEKNINELVDYMTTFNNPKTTLLIAGGGPYLDKLKAYAKESSFSKNIIFTGMIDPDDVPLYYRLGDIFVSASNSETQGLTYVECLACGVPAVCRKDRCLDGVIVNGKNGWQYTDFEDFKTSINTILEDDNLRQQLSENAKDWAMRNFSKEIFANRILEIYRQSSVVG